MRFLRNGLLAVTLLAAMVLPPNLIIAATGGAVSIFPSASDEEPDRSWFVYELDPGKSHQDILEITNLEDETITLRLYPADATTTKNGGFSLLNFGEENVSIGQWITLPVERLTLGPKETRQIPFTLNVPPRADVGEHLGGILVEKLQPDQIEQQGNFQLNIVTRIGVRVYLTVPGELISRLRLMGIALNSDNGDIKLSYHLKNEGNVQLHPKLDFELSRWGKTIAAQESVSLGSILRGDQIASELTLSALRLPGRYEINGTIHYGDGQSVTFQEGYLFLPLWSLGAFSGLLLVLGLIVYGIYRVICFLRRVRQLEKQLSSKAHSVDAPVQSRSPAKHNTTTPPPVVVPPPWAIIEHTKTLQTTSGSPVSKSRKKTAPKTKSRNSNQHKGKSD